RVTAGQISRSTSVNGIEGQNNRKRVKLMSKTNIEKTMPCGVGAMVAMVLAIGFSASAIAQNTVTEVVGGLHSPRGLAFGSGGQLFVAQTGDETTAGSIIEIRSEEHTSELQSR